MKLYPRASRTITPDGRQHRPPNRPAMTPEPSEPVGNGGSRGPAATAAAVSAGTPSPTGRPRPRGQGTGKPTWPKSADRLRRRAFGKQRSRQDQRDDDDDRNQHHSPQLTRDAPGIPKMGRLGPAVALKYPSNKPVPSCRDQDRDRGDRQRECWGQGACRAAYAVSPR